MSAVTPRPAPEPPVGLLAELTHRCPLRCGYCSNPLELTRAAAELDTATWKRVFSEAAAAGVLQIHLSGGEPAVRHDLALLVAHARSCDLYTNLITSGVGLDRDRLAALDDAGLDHVQLSFQDSVAETADGFAGYRGGHARKLEFARDVRERELALTVNAVVHRANIERVPALIELAVSLGAGRIEIANVQYHGWASRNRAAMLPTREQLERAVQVVDEARARLRGVLSIDFVPPDYFARRPKACMEGWGRRFLAVTPDGRVLPCHAAASIPGLVFERVGERPLAEIWRHAEAFERFRGTGWMREPCRSCDRREEDFGGCRCQALALAGDPAATDPVCELSPDRPRIDEWIERCRDATDSILLRGERRPD